MDFFYLFNLILQLTTSFDSIRVEKKCTKLKEEYFTLPFV